MGQENASSDFGGRGKVVSPWGGDISPSPVSPPDEFAAGHGGTSPLSHRGDEQPPPLCAWRVLPAITTESQRLPDFIFQRTPKIPPWCHGKSAVVTAAFTALIAHKPQMSKAEEKAFVLREKKKKDQT